ncbi:MAG: hypothetical protein ABJB40_09875 [Acidobacteriota bacterium]
MAANTEPNPPFWSSLQGILTGVGGVLVALTGLVTALYTTGAIGSKATSNSVPPVNTAVTQSAVPAAAAAPNAESDRYKSLTGKWVVTEEPSLDFDEVKKVTWQYDAVVSGNVLTLTGKISAIDGDKNLSENEEDIRATYVTTLIGLSGVGEYKVKKTEEGTTTSYPATIRFDDNLSKIIGSVEIKGQQPVSLSGKKQ